MKPTQNKKNNHITYYVIIFLFFFIFPGISIYGQKSTILTDFYQQEWNNFKDFIRNKNERSNPDTSFNVTFYYLKADVSIDTGAKYLKGNLICKFKSRINSLFKIGLSLQKDLIVDSITGNSLSYSISGDSITIILDSTYSVGQAAEVCIWYQGVPKLAGGYKGLRYETHNNGEPVIATLSTPYLAHYWYPCKDGPEDKADSVYIDITVPDTAINGNNVIAVSNGLLENITVSNNKATFCWRHRYPIVTYYVMMAISNYSHSQHTFVGQHGESFPIDYYYFKEHESQSQLGVAGMPDAMHFYSDIYGKYPFWKEKYGMSELGYYSAIENQTNTIINNMSLPWFSMSIHELAHMWFGDMITCADWHHAWMNEGFATYSEALWQEYMYGDSAYHYFFKTSPAFMGGTLYLQNELDTFNIFQAIIYQKGAWVLHMLRGVLGDSVFFNCLKSYACSPGFMYKNSSTEDFRNLCENISGSNLTTFFEQWVYDEYYPKYHYNYIQDTISKILTLRIFQAQDSIDGWREMFEMPLQIKIQDVNGNDTLITVQNNQKNQQYYFQLNGNVSHTDSTLLIDPYKWIIRKTVFDPLLPIGITEVPVEGFQINIYPNPVTDIIRIVIPQNYNKTSFEIFDPSGKLVKSGYLYSPSIDISTHDLSNGLYFIKIVAGKTTATLKFLIQ